MAQGTRLGLIARADNTGLGIQTHDLYKFLQPHRTYIIDLTKINAEMGKQTALFMERYPDGIIIDGFPTPEAMDFMLDDIDVLFTVEIPYGYELFEKARQRGVKTILHYNYEFLDYLQDPDLPLPDLFLAPSIWHFDDVRAITESKFAKLRYLPPPVDRKLIPFRQRTQANHFVHVAGHKTFMDRNGTEVVVDALKYIKSEIKVSIFTQNQELAELIKTAERPPNVELEVIDIEVKEYQDIYNNPSFDVLLLPRRYGGLSLQLNEALSSGMPVVMPNISPNNTILPPASLIDVEDSVQIRTRTLIDCYEISPKVLATKMEQLHANTKLVTNLSTAADQYADKISWETMLPKYLKLLDEVCRQ